MHTEKEPSNQDPLSSLGYEARDVDIRKIGNATILFFGFTFFCLAVSGVVFYLMNRSAFEQKPPTQPFARQNRMPANTPILQGNLTAKTDIQVMRKREEAILKSTGWVDKEKGVVRIPIDRAIQILGNRGLPKVETSVQAISRGNTTDQNPATSQDSLP